MSPYLFLPAVPGTLLTADAVTFTLDGYAIDQTIPEVTVGSSTAHVPLQGSGYGIDNAYMTSMRTMWILDTKVTDPHAKFEKHQDYCLMIDYALDEGSFPRQFLGRQLSEKDKFKLAGFEDAVVTAVTKTSVPSVSRS